MGRLEISVFIGAHNSHIKVIMAFHWRVKFSAFNELVKTQTILIDLLQVLMITEQRDCINVSFVNAILDG